MKKDNNQSNKEFFNSDDIEERELTMEELSLVTAASMESAKRNKRNVKTRRGKLD